MTKMVGLDNANYIAICRTLWANNQWQMCSVEYSGWQSVTDLERSVSCRFVIDQSDNNVG